MWSAFRRDFSEIVATVRDDTSLILTSLDTKIGSGSLNDETIDLDNADYSKDHEEDGDENEEEEDVDVDEEKDYKEDNSKQRGETNFERNEFIGNDQERKVGAVPDQQINTTMIAGSVGSVVPNFTSMEDSIEQSKIASSKHVEPSTIHQQHPSKPVKGTTYRSEAEREAYRRMNIAETYMSPLLLEEDTEQNNDDSNQKQILEFIQSFQIDDIKQKEISTLVEENPSLKEIFEELVPEHVSYADFWKRYYYRCDPVRIQNEIDLENEAAIAARAAALKKVSNFLGGAVDAVASAFIVTAAPATTKIHPKDQQPLARSSYLNNDDDEEEEELGWDDDDEDEDDDDLDVNGKDTDNVEPHFDEAPATEELIEFNDVALEQTKEELKLALELRDQLHQTVELQKLEIVNLQQKLNEANATTGAGSEVTDGYDDDIVQRLKLKLFETEAELEALKQKKMDEMIYDEDGNVSVNRSADLEEQCKQQQKRIESLQVQLDEANSLVNAKNTEIDELITAMQIRKNEFEETIEALHAEVKFLKGNFKASQKDSTCYVNELKECIDLQTTDLKTCQDEITHLKERHVSTLDEHGNQLRLLKEAIENKDVIISKLEEELSILLQQQKQNNDKQQCMSLASSTTPDTITTADGMVRVESTTHSGAPARPGGVASNTTMNVSTTKSSQPPTLLLSATKIEDTDDASDWGDDWD